jgi:hypothetical protein
MIIFMIDKTLHTKIKTLLKLAVKNQTDEIYNILNNFQGSTKQKGDLFEYFLAELYNGIGCKVKPVGGKNDKGVDLVIYDANSPSKVYAIMQIKNVKTALSTERLRIEYAKFFGDAFSSQQAAVEKYDCKEVFIISLNGYNKNAHDIKSPENYQVHLYDWSNVKNLIANYSKSRQTNRYQKDCPFQLAKKNYNHFFNIIILLIIIIAMLWLFF